MIKQPVEADVDMLLPVLTDPTLMALLRNRYVPASFLFKKVFRKPTPESCLRVIHSLMALQDGGASKVGLFELDVHFVIQSGVLHVGGGRSAGRRQERVISEVGMPEVVAALSPTSRQMGRDFATLHYDKLKEPLTVYEKVLRECERSTSLVQARERVGVDEAEWQRIKGWMGRFGIVKDIVCARNILVPGSLIREIEQRFLERRVDDVVPELLRQQIDTAEHNIASVSSKHIVF